MSSGPNAGLLLQPEHAMLWLDLLRKTQTAGPGSDMSTRAAAGGHNVQHYEMPLGCHGVLIQVGFSVTQHLRKLRPATALC